MELRPLPSWSDLVGSAEEFLQTVPPDGVPSCLGDLERLKALAWVRLAAPAPPEAALDRLLTADQAAARLQVPVSALRRKHYPFAVRVSPGRVRFSAAGLERWIRSRSRMGT